MLSDFTIMHAWSALLAKVRDDVSFYAMFPDLFTSAARRNWLRQICSLSELEAVMQLPSPASFEV